MKRSARQRRKVKGDAARWPREPKRLRQEPLPRGVPVVLGARGPRECRYRPRDVAAVEKHTVGRAEAPGRAPRGGRRWERPVRAPETRGGRASLGRRAAKGDRRASRRWVREPRESGLGRCRRRATVTSFSLERRERGTGQRRRRASSKGKRRSVRGNKWRHPRARLCVAGDGAQPASRVRRTWAGKRGPPLPSPALPATRPWGTSTPGACRPPDPHRRWGGIKSEDLSKLPPSLGCASSRSFWRLQCPSGSTGPTTSQ